MKTLLDLKKEKKKYIDANCNYVDNGYITEQTRVHKNT